MKFFVKVGVLLVALAAVYFIWDRSNDAPELVGLPVAHSVYVWQRSWGEQVFSAVEKASDKVTGFVVLGGEISWSGQDMKFVSVAVDYGMLAGIEKPVGIALRIGPCPGSFDKGGAAVKRIAEYAGSLIAKARENGLEVSEFQIDFDCPESRLKGYRYLIESVRGSIASVPLTITALPSWLKHRSFARLAKLTDGYVLQVHSLERPKSIDAPVVLCERQASLKWVRRAGRIGVPFRVALPTYGYLVVFGEDGKFMGLIAEGQGRSWDGQTNLVKVSSDAVEMAGLVAAWKKSRPACMEGVIWYRLPIESDELNWRWATLSTVISGKIPVNSLRVEVEYPSAGLAEIMLVNDGDTDQRADLPIKVECSQEKIVGSDGFRGYVIVETTPTGFLLAHDGSRAFSTIRPAERLKAGWIRTKNEMEIKAYVQQH